MAKRKVWTQEEERYLEINSKIKTDKEIAYKLKTTEATVKYKRKKMNLKGLSDKPRYNWSKQEDKYIINNLKIKTIQEIADVLNISKEKVEYRIIKLDMKKGRMNEWSEDEIKLLKKVYPYIYNKNLTRYFPNRNNRAIQSQAIKLGIRKTTCTLPKIFFVYKEILEGFRKNGFTGSKLDISAYKREHIKLLFKYYLEKNNISDKNRDFWVSQNILKIINDSKLNYFYKNRENGLFDDWFDFISFIFPKYNFLRDEFKCVAHKKQYARTNKSIYDNKRIRFKILNEKLSYLKKAKIIEKDEDILKFSKKNIQKMIHSTMIKTKGIECILEYFKENNIKFDESFIYTRKQFNGINFGSIEEKDVFKFIKNNYNFKIEKNKKRFHKNKEKTKYYIPDYIMNDNIIIEYFGFYSYKNEKAFVDYRKRTEEKIKFFKNLEGYEFIELYPKDIKNNFKGVQLKLNSFFNLH